MVKGSMIRVVFLLLMIFNVRYSMSADDFDNEWNKHVLYQNTQQPAYKISQKENISKTVFPESSQQLERDLNKTQLNFNATNHGTSIDFSVISISALTVVTSLITVCGNILVLSAFFIERTLRSATNYFIASLAITDILIGIFSMNLYSYYLLMNSWNLGDIACDLWLALDYTACLTSQYTVFLITLDRFFSVKIPTKYRNWRTDTKVLIMVFITWIIPTTVFFTIIFGWTTFYTDYDRVSSQCEVPFAKDAYFMTILTICYFWVTLIVMCCLYGGIYHVAARLQKKADAKRQKLTSLFSMAGQTMSRIGVSLPQNLDDNLKNDNSESNYTCAKFTSPSKAPLTSTSSTSGERRELCPNQRKDGSSIEIHPEECSSMNCFQLPNSCEVDWDTTKDRHPPTFVQNQLQIMQMINSPVLYEEDEENNQESGFNSKKTSSIRVKFEARISPTSSLSVKHENFESIETLKATSSPIWRSRPTESDQSDQPYQSQQSNEMSFLLEDDSLRPQSRALRQILNKNQTNISCQLLVNRPRKSFFTDLKKCFCLDLCQKRKAEKVQRGRNENRARKALRTISFILGAFVICWTPYHIVVLIEAYHPNSVNKHIYNLSYWLCYMNSPINPFCYALANAQFKKTFLRILTGDVNKT